MEVSEKKKTMSELMFDLMELESVLIENDGVLDEDQAALFELTQENFKKKVDGYCSMIRRFQDQVDICKREKARIEQRIKRWENAAEYMKNTLLAAVERFGDVVDTKTGRKAIETAINRITTRQSESVEIIDESKVPADFKTFKLSLKFEKIDEVPKKYRDFAEPVIDKTLLKKQLKSEESLPEDQEENRTQGAELVKKKNLSLT